jgi:hypothetical protein
VAGQGASEICTFEIEPQYIDLPLSIAGSDEGPACEAAPKWTQQEINYHIEIFCEASTLPGFGPPPTKTLLRTNLLGALLCCGLTEMQSHFGCQSISTI